MAKHHMMIKQLRYAVIVRQFAVLFLLLVSLQALAADTQTATAVKIPAVINDIIKSENDDRVYRYLVLPNQMRVLLISDPKTEKSAAALDVNIGSGEDPKGRLGLAHFLEHMLFLGTKKYPKPGEYQEYINAHSGEHNAYTSLEHTNYYFDIGPQYLEPALDRFAQFFIAPLLDADYVSRERNAVYSEYTAKIKDESRRAWDVLSELTDSENKSAKFSVGTLETLADYRKKNVHNDLLKFYQTYYSSNLMTLVVLGKETPEQLEKMVRSYFLGVTNKNILLTQEEKALFHKGFLPKKVYVRPLQEQREVSLIFPLPVFEKWYREKPVDYIGYMLGHEGAGSLYQTLHEKGWIESLEAGSNISNRQSASFSISIALTKEGYRHQDDIVDTVYQAIDQLKNKGVEKWRYNEQSVINDTFFRYQEKSDVLNYVRTLANNLHYYEARDVIAGSMMMKRYDENLIHRYLDYLKPENSLVVINAPDVSVTKKSRYYQTQYSIAKVDDTELARRKAPKKDSLVQLPPPNEFVAKQFRIKKTDENKTIENPLLRPVVLRDGPNVRLWFKQDDRFNTPRGGIYIYARSASSIQGARGAALTEIFVRLLNSDLNSYAYAAGLAGLEVSVARRSRGIGIEITGYNDKQGLLLTRVLDAMTSPAFKQKDFDGVKETLLRELENQDKQTPYRQLGNELPAVISKTEYEPDRLRDAIKKIDLSLVQNFSLNWLKSLHADILIHGNFIDSDALKLSSIIENKLSLSEPIVHRDPQGFFVRIPSGEHGFLYGLTAIHDDVAVMHYIQGADVSFSEQAKLKMLAQLMEADFFHQLRTEQQLGYVVYGYYATVGPVPGLVFVVQSPSHTAEDIDQRMTAFFAQFAQTLTTMSKEDFEQYRSALLANTSEAPKNIAEEGAEYWGQIAIHNLEFDQREQLIAQIKLLDQKSMADFFWKTFLSPNVHRLVLVVSPKTQPISRQLTEKYQQIGDVEEFKAAQKYFILK